ncbi:MAG: hypothetical protein ACFFB0_13125 [Promethearchaeota archaeon]
MLISMGIVGLIFIIIGINLIFLEYPPYSPINALAITFIILDSIFLALSLSIPMENKFGCSRCWYCIEL